MAFYNPVESLFLYLANESGFLIDQIRYIVLMLLSYPLALILRFLLHPNHTPLVVRYLYSLVMGLVLGLLCFGWQQITILLSIISISYLLLLLIPPKHTHWCSMVWAMSAMATTHIYRMITDYGGYHLDFSGPLMIMVQKITLVAFSLHDGKARPDPQLSRDQRAQKIQSPPSLLQYFSYMFNFHSILAGPTCTFKEYSSFIDGSNFRASSNAANSTQAGKPAKEPSLIYPVLTKLALSIASVSWFVVLTSYVDNEFVLVPQHGLPYRLLLAYVNGFRLRGRYYFIWLLAESINNCAGLGFAGYDERGGAKWNLISNLNLWDTELALNLRQFAGGWNSMTALWLRRCIYERVTFHPTLMTFAVSSMWHGFYPGYYFCFIHLAIATEAARKMRRVVRPYFQGSAGLRRFYDILTWFLTHRYTDFSAVCLDMMWFDKCMLYWSYFYYLPAICSVVVMFLPIGKSRKPNSATSSDAEGKKKDDAPSHSDGVIPKDIKTD